VRGGGGKTCTSKHGEEELTPMTSVLPSVGKSGPFACLSQKKNGHGWGGGAEKRRAADKLKA